MDQETTCRHSSRTSALFIRLAENSFRFKWLLLLLVVGVTVLSFTQMRCLRFDNSNEAWFVENDPAVELLDKFHDVFGNDHFVILLFESDDFFEVDNIRLLGRLADALGTGVPYVNDVIWLGNVEYIEGDEEGINIYELLESIPETPEDMTGVRKKALNEPTYINKLIATDAKAYTIVLEMDKYPEIGDTLDPQNEIAPAIRKILAKPEFAGLKPHLVGTPIFHYDYSELAGRETPKLMGMCLLVQMFLLIWLGRGIRGMAVSLTIVFLSIIWTLGAIGLMGFTLNTMIIIMPSLLICVGIGDSIHFVSEYHDHLDQGETRRNAMLKTFSMVGLPCLLTTLTTMGAFLSFLTVSIKPFREFGAYSAVGVVCALILTYILVPFFYSFGMNKKVKPMEKDIQKKTLQKRHDFFDRLLAMIHTIVTARPGLVVLFFSLLSLVSLFGALNIKLESNMVHLLSTKVPLRQAIDFVDERMGGSLSVEIMLDTGKPDGVKSLNFLQDINTLQGFVDKQPMVTKTSSVVDILKKMRRALHNNDQEYYSLPDSNEAVSQYMFLYETAGGDQLDTLVSFNYDIARLNVKMPFIDTQTGRRFIQDVEEFSKKIFDDSVHVELTGVAAGVKALNDRMGEGVKSSFIAVLIAVTVMMILFLRSVKLALVSMIPNVFPVVITLGLMGFAGIDMDMPMMCFSAIIIGVAVDDTIHFFRRYRRGFTASGNYSDALKTTLATVGRPITFTTITLILGFGVMIFSVMTGWSHFGSLAGFAFLWALLADFFFAPAVMLLVKPLGPERIT